MYKLILLDYSMPEMDGLEVAARMVELLKSVQLPKPFICCVTSYTDLSYRTRALASGMDDMLAKPVHVDDIRHLVSVHCQDD